MEMLVEYTDVSSLCLSKLDESVNKKALNQNMFHNETYNTNESNTSELSGNIWNYMNYFISLYHHG